MTSEKSSLAKEIAPGVAFVATVFVNAYMIGNASGPWVLVDTGVPDFEGRIRRAAAERFGEGSRPEAIVLTHGHFDHAGSALALSRSYDVPVYVHPLELPYLNGKSDYPPQDPTVGGALAFMSRFFSHEGINLGDRVRPFDPAAPLPWLPEWSMHHTPGHTAGHTVFFRADDGFLIAGDALATVNQDSAVSMITMTKELYRPASPFTTDWTAARESVEELAALKPFTVAAGHGKPMSSPDMPAKLADFAKRFTPPRKGRYVASPAVTDETGVVKLPPPVPDPLPKVAAGLGLAALSGVGIAAILRSRSRRRQPRVRVR